jgi:hypothetical protein
MQIRGRRSAWLRAWVLAAAMAGAMAGCSSKDGSPVAKMAKAAAAAASTAPTAPGTGSCPLSPGQQRRAVADFHRMMPAIASPRCANCHGGLDVFAPSANELHGGKQIDMDCAVDKQAEAMGLGDGETVCLRDFSTCSDCHDQVSRWVTPGKQQFFAGHSPVQICNQFKVSETPDSFRTHVTSDQLVLAGFLGKRGQDLAPKSPPITHAEFQAAALDWLSLVSHGGDFYRGKDCGCVAAVPRLRITDHYVDSSDAYGVERDLTYVADLMLDEDGDGYTGSGTYSGFLVTRKLNCHNGMPEDRKVHQLQGAFDATASYRETGGGKGMVNYNFDTLDWPVELGLPFGMMGTSNDPKEAADMIDMAHHMGATMGLMLETTGPKTVIHTRKVDDGRGSHMAGCVKSASHDEDVTIEIIPAEVRP